MSGIGYFRPLRTALSTRAALAIHARTFDRTDERCKHKVRRDWVTAPCGKQASEEIGGRWYCARHAKKVKAQP